MQDRIHDFFFGKEVLQKTFKNASKICLYSLLLRFYESNIHFGREDVVQVPNLPSPWIRL